MSKLGSLIAMMTYGAAAAAAPLVPMGGLASVRVRDSVMMDQVNGVGPDGSGWVAEVTLKGLVNLAGTIDASKLVLNVRDPGFSNVDGSPTTVNRRIYGNAHVRRQAPAGAERMVYTNGSDVTIFIALTETIFAGTTIVSASIGAGFYTESVASISAINTNASDRPYTKPLVGWINPQHEMATGSTHWVELVAFHEHGRMNQQVAAVKFQATDGVTTGSESLVTLPELSTLQTQGFKPEVWAANVDMSTLTNGAICHVNAKVYPFIGDASAVMDLATDGVAWPTSLPPTRLRVVCDRTGAYGGAYAYVKNGVTGGVVSATPATARATPFPTIAAAQTAMAAWNNANRGHNNLDGGTIRLMDDNGANYTHQFTSFASNTLKCYVVIEKDPESSAVVGMQCANTSGFSIGPALVKYKDLKIERPTAQLYNFFTSNTSADAGRTLLCIQGCTLGDFSGKRFTWQYQTKYYLNTTIPVAADFAPNGENNLVGGNVASMIGCTGPSAFTYCNPKMLVGCNLPGLYSGVDTNPNGDGDHGKILYNNKAFGLSHFKATANTLNYGLACVQNVCEVGGGSGSGHPMPMFQDGDLTTVRNYVSWYNTAVGERSSRLYNDTGVRVVKLGRDIACVYDNTNIKDDRLVHGGTGAWEYAYGTGNSYSVILHGDVQRMATSAPHNDNGLSPWGGNATHPSTKFNLQRAVNGGYTQAQIQAMFINWTCAPKANPTTGGDYRLAPATAAVFQTIPQGFGGLRYDILGNLRRTDGTGCCGAYESQ